MHVADFLLLEEALPVFVALGHEDLDAGEIEDELVVALGYELLADFFVRVTLGVHLAQVLHGRATEGVHFEVTQVDDEDVLVFGVLAAVGDDDVGGAEVDF